MPYKSKAQMRFMFAAESRGDVAKGTARRWAHHTKTPLKKLPERVKKADAALAMAVYGLPRPASVVDLATQLVLGINNGSQLPGKVAAAAPAPPPQTFPPPAGQVLGRPAPNPAAGITPPAAQPLIPPGQALSQVMQQPPVQPAPQAPQKVAGVVGLALKLAAAQVAQQQPQQPVPGQFKPSPLLSGITDPQTPIAHYLGLTRGRLTQQAPPMPPNQDVATGQQLQNNIDLQKHSAVKAANPLHRPMSRPGVPFGGFPGAPAGGFGLRPGFAPPPSLYGYGAAPAAQAPVVPRADRNAGRHAVDQDHTGAAPDYDGQLQGLNRQKAWLEASMRSNPANAAAFGRKLKAITAQTSALEAMRAADEKFESDRQARLSASRATVGAGPSPFDAPSPAAPGEDKPSAAPGAAPPPAPLTDTAMTAGDKPGGGAAGLLGTAASGLGAAAAAGAAARPNPFAAPVSVPDVRVPPAPEAPADSPSVTPPASGSTLAESANSGNREVARLLETSDALRAARPALYRTPEEALRDDPSSAKGSGGYSNADLPIPQLKLDASDRASRTGADVGGAKAGPGGEVAALKGPGTPTPTPDDESPSAAPADPLTLPPAPASMMNRLRNVGIGSAGAGEVKGRSGPGQPAAPVAATPTTESAGAAKAAPPAAGGTMGAPAAPKPIAAAPPPAAAAPKPAATPATPASTPSAGGGLPKPSMGAGPSAFAKK